MMHWKAVPGHEDRWTWDPPEGNANRRQVLLKGDGDTFVEVSGTWVHRYDRAWLDETGIHGKDVRSRRDSGMIGLTDEALWERMAELATPDSEYWGVAINPDAADEDADDAPARVRTTGDNASRASGPEHEAPETDRRE